MVLWGVMGAQPGLLAQAEEPWIEASERFRSPHRPDSALAALDSGLLRAPTSYALLWRASREALSLGMTEDGDARARHFAEAVDYGRRAIAVDSSRIEGRAWLSAALGRYALDQGPRTRVQLANEIFALASGVVESDANNGVAQHVLGQWHAEVLRAGRLTRFIARRLLGGDTFAHASWDEAVLHLEAAVRAEPTALIHGLELARVYLDVGRREDALAELQRVLALPDTEATDPQHRERARALLEQLLPPPP